MSEERSERLPTHLTVWSHCPRCGERLLASIEEGSPCLRCSSCSFIHYAAPAPTVAVTLLNHGRDSVLLCQRAREPKQGSWCLPGGYMEWYETPEQAAARELQEETGLAAGSFRLIGAFASDHSPWERTTLTLHYLAIAEDGEPIAGSDALAVRWVPLAEVGELAFTNHRQGLLAALALLDGER